MRRQITTKLLIGILLILSAGMASSAELLLDISYIESPKGLQVTGNTNVPDGTKIGIELEGNGYRAQDFDVFVKDGRYASGYFTNKGQKLAGS